MRKPKDRSWRNPDKRMRRAVELRLEGRSLREIGTQLAVSYETIRRDLVRWETQNVEEMLSHLGVTYEPPSSLM